MWFTHKVSVTVDASLLLLILLLLVFFLLLVFLRDHVVQVTQVMLGEHVVHGLAHSHQCQDLQNKEVFWLDPLPRNPRVFFFFLMSWRFFFFLPWQGRQWQPLWTWGSRAEPNTGPGWRWRGGCVSGARVAGRWGQVGVWLASGPAGGDPWTNTDRLVC